MGVFSFLAVILGLAAAVKLSALAAGYIGKAVNVSDRWLPVISFLAVFIVVVLLVRVGANAIQRTVEFAMLGWVNRLGGVLLYAILFTVAYSIFIFYAEQLSIIKQDTIQRSLTYSFVQPWGPGAIDALGSVIPFFKGVFGELSAFFDNISDNLSG